LAGRAGGLVGREELGEKSPVMLKLWYNELNNEALVTEMIAEAAREGASERLRESLERQFSPGVKLGTWDVGLHRGQETLVAARETTLGALSRLPNEMWSRPACVAVDDIQKVKLEAEAVTKALEDGMPGAPVAPFYAGLSSLKSVLESPPEIGLSRLSREHMKAIGCHEEGDAGKTVGMLLEEFWG